MRDRHAERVYQRNFPLCGYGTCTRDAVTLVRFSGSALDLSNTVSAYCRWHADKQVDRKTSAREMGESPLRYWRGERVRKIIRGGDDAE